MSEVDIPTLCGCPPSVVVGPSPTVLSNLCTMAGRVSGTAYYLERFADTPVAPLEHTLLLESLLDFAEALRVFQGSKWFHREVTGNLLAILERLGEQSLRVAHLCEKALTTTDADRRANYIAELDEPTALVIYVAQEFRRIQFTVAVRYVEVPS